MSLSVLVTRDVAGVRGRCSCASVLVAGAVTMRVGDVAVVHGVVDAGDGDGLRRRSSWYRRMRQRGIDGASAVSALEIGISMVVPAPGASSSTTVKVAVPPASVVLPLIGLTVMPGGEVCVPGSKGSKIERGVDGFVGRVARSGFQHPVAAVARQIVRRRARPRPSGSRGDRLASFHPSRWRGCNHTG